MRWALGITAGTALGVTLTITIQRTWRRILIEMLSRGDSPAPSRRSR